MITRRTFSTLAALTGLSAALGPSRAVAVGVHPRPVVAELFTSQGCHSCPPADAYLGQLAERATTRRDVIALAYHIDYWDYIGWPDPFADPAYTARQRGYRPRLGNRTIYTPQMVIDGEVDAVGSRWWEVDKLIADRLSATQATRPSVPVHLALSAGTLEIDIPDAHVDRTCEVVMAAYDAHHVTEVKRGENGGKRLEDFNVVRHLRVVARYDGGGGRRVIEPGTWSDRDGGVAVLLQEQDHGPIVGAAQLAL
jgi:hypothetical protein